MTENQTEPAVLVTDCMKLKPRLRFGFFEKLPKTKPNRTSASLVVRGEGRKKSFVTNQKLGWPVVVLFHAILNLGERTRAMRHWTLSGHIVSWRDARVVTWAADIYFTPNEDS
jgi:hypothetical protein